MSDAKRPSTKLSLTVAACLLLATGMSSSAIPSYEIDLFVDWASGTFSGTTTVVAANCTAASIDGFLFRLFANNPGVYGEAYLSVTKISAEGETIDFPAQPASTTLWVPLPSPLEPEQTVSLVLEFVGKTAPSPLKADRPKTGYGILTKNDDSMVLSAFYPMLSPQTVQASSLEEACGIGDLLWGEAADYSVTLRIDRDLAPAASGRLIASHGNGDDAVHRFEAQAARDFSLVLTLDYEEIELQSSGQTLRAFFTPPHQAASVRAIELASDALDLYERAVGSLPFDEVDIVEVPLQRVAGVEFSGLILVSEAYAENPYTQFYDIILSHEMAHQWFYAAVGNDPSASPWLDEAFATFLSNLFLAEFRGGEAASAERARWRRSYEAAHDANQEQTIADPACSFATSSAYSAFVYDGGAWFLSQLRDTVGDEIFFEVLSTYYIDNLGRIATKEALLSSFESACDCSLAELCRTFGILP